MSEIVMASVTLASIHVSMVQPTGSNLALARTYSYIWWRHRSLVMTDVCRPRLKKKQIKFSIFDSVQNRISFLLTFCQNGRHETRFNQSLRKTHVNYCKFLILREDLIPQFNRFPSNRENKKSQMPNYYHIFL